MTKVSFSQYSTYSTCPRMYKHQYIDKLGESSANIATIFGTAMHETIQHYLSVFYGVSKKQANELNLDKMLLDVMKREFIKEKEKMSVGAPATQLEMEEHFGDGRRILEWFVKYVEKLYTKTGYELVAIEMPLNYEIKKGVHFIAFIDIVLREIGSGEIIIIDLKTSTRGWNKYQKEDKIKNAQILIYKKFYADLFGTPLQKIRVEFQIMKRKLMEDSPYPQPRISKHIPANGKPSVMKAFDEFMFFIDTVFDENGDRRLDIEYPKTPGKNKKNCKYCEFFERKICDGVE
jgi:CRISPR/Cas system-associated exonuclease Cas4 (RecB family)